METKENKAERKTVLIADDEMLKLMTLKSQLGKNGFYVITETDGKQALQTLRSETVHALITDVRMPGLDGLELLEKSKELEPGRPVLVMSGFGAVEDAVKAMRAGAEDYLTKPVSAEEIMMRLEKALAVSALSHEYRKLQEEVQGLDGPGEPVIASPPMQEVFGKLKRAAETDATVLLCGETGSGKKVCARYLHNRSSRSKGPFVVVSCAALAPGVVESELFGHEKGAFTGATFRREGRLAIAQGGTLFLDDVDDVPLQVQTKLLRVLEDSTYERVGGTETIKADVRFAAATKKNLEDMVKRGGFRDDLMYRLKVVSIDMPPLRERREEIIPLAEHFLDRSIQKMGRAPKRFDSECLEVMQAFHWPGNIRELEHVIDSLVAIHQGKEIRAGDLPGYMDSHGKNPLFTLQTDGREYIDLEKEEAFFEKQLLAWALEKSGGSQGKAAEFLKIARSTFQYKWAKAKTLAE